MLERSDTPWYGSGRLFRQSQVGEWRKVFGEVAGALAEELEHAATTSYFGVAPPP
jgi:hypothetical protein